MEAGPKTLEIGMRTLRLLLTVTTLLLWAGQSAAQTVYRTVDEDGRVTYTDRPPANNEDESEARLPHINAVPETPTRSQSQRQSRERPTEQQELRYEPNIISPTPESSVPPGQRDLSITVALDRDLRDGHFLAYYLNGELLTETRERQFVVQEIVRGTHQIDVEVLAPDGSVLGSASPVTVYVHRTSVINRPGS